MFFGDLFVAIHPLAVQPIIYKIALQPLGDSSLRFFRPFVIDGGDNHVAASTGWRVACGCGYPRGHAGPDPSPRNDG